MSINERQGGKLRLGFVGTGSITESIVKGLLRSNYPVDRISLSPRNHERAHRLAAMDERISVATDNQEVLDTSNVICLAVVPSIADSTLAPLMFSSKHHVISFIATYSLSSLERVINGVPTIVRAVPLPMVELLQGPTVICPKDPVASRIFGSLGTVIEVEDDVQYDALCALAGVMGSFYALIQEQVSWLGAQGIEDNSAKAYVTQMYLGLANAAGRDDRPLAEQAAVYSTKGGLNEQMTRELSEAGVFTTFRGALDNLMRRIRGA